MSSGEYSVYPQRWTLLATVSLLNISNAALWISIASVATKAAEFYHHSVAMVDWFSLIYFVVAVPSVGVATWVISHLGIRQGVHAGAYLNFSGSLLRAVSTIPIIPLSHDWQFWLGMVGQTLCGTAQLFILSLPTTISQKWFADNQRVAATTVLAMSNPMGVVVGQGLTPLFTNQPDDIPIMNAVWCVPALVALLLAIFTVRSSTPPTPPSLSASEEPQDQNYFRSLGALFCNSAYIILFVTVGSIVGVFSTISSKMEQVLCSRGYSDDFAGLCGALLLACGLPGVVVIGILVGRTKLVTPAVKVAYCCVALVAILLFQLMRFRNIEAYLAIVCGLLGFVAFGTYPTILELSVEATYPIDESISNAFIFMSAQVQGVVLMLLSKALSWPLSGEDRAYETCTIHAENQVAVQDYTVFLLSMAGYVTLNAVVFIIFFHTPYRRLQLTNHLHEPEKEQNKILYGSVSVHI